MTIEQTSPTSVRCSLDKEQVKGNKNRRSLASSLKSLALSSDSAHGNTVCTDVSSTCRSTTIMASSSLRERKVRFFPLVRIKDTISRHDMIEDEIERCFIQDEDYDEIRSHIKRIIQKFKSYHSLGDPLPSPLPKCCMDFKDDIETMENGMFLCTRGLERISPDSYYSYREMSIDAVLEEQDFQDCEGYSDVDVIAELYAKINSPCKFRAVYLAMEDRIEAVGTKEAHWKY